MNKKTLITKNNASKIFSGEKAQTFFMHGGTSFCVSATLTQADPERTYLSNLVTTNGGTSWSGNMYENNTTLTEYLYDYDNHLTCSADMSVFNPKTAQKMVSNAEKPALIGRNRENTL